MYLSATFSNWTNCLTMWKAVYDHTQYDKDYNHHHPFAIILNDKKQLTTQCTQWNKTARKERRMGRKMPVVCMLVVVVVAMRWYQKPKQIQFTEESKKLTFWLHENKFKTHPYKIVFSQLLRHHPHLSPVP